MGGLREYASPQAFKAALEERVRRRAQEQGRPLNRVRTLAVMERFLARALQVLPESALVKGGLALELRVARARTTRDIDLRLLGESESLLDALERAAALITVPDDRLRFRVAPDASHPELEGDGVVYEGYRFVVSATIAERAYGDPFGVDVAFGDVVHGKPEEMSGSDLFGFVGVPSVRARVYPVETHIAEKLHAYTLVRSGNRQNTRVKDLPDMALLAGARQIAASDLRAAIEKTFALRASHPVPVLLPAPPPMWDLQYERMAADEKLPWRTLAEVLAVARAFLEPALQGQDGTWDPAAQRWR